MLQTMKHWMVPLLFLISTMVYAIAEELTLTTYYPSPRGVYNELRTRGDVAIGKLDPPSARLEIVGSGATSATSALRIKNVDGTALLEVQNGGNVGIGTANPGTKLHVEGTATDPYLLTLRRGTSDPWMKFIGRSTDDSGGITWRDNTDTVSKAHLHYQSGRFNIETANTSRIVVTDTGNVGIGTASPGERLVVNGGIQLGTSSGANAGTLRWNGTDVQVYTGIAWVNLGVPAGTVSSFNSSTCPAGWTELTSARGRYLVGLPASGTPGATVGTALSNLENRPVGEHSHLMETRAIFGTGGNWAVTTQVTDRVRDPMATNPFGIPGTNAPYIQLLACQKN